MKKLHYLLFAMIMGLAVSFTSCSSDNDSPLDPIDPVDPTPEVPVANKTIVELRALTTGDAVEVPADFIFKGIVVSSQAESNNFYQAIYLQDGDVAVKISCLKEGDKFYETLVAGQEVFVKAAGLFMAKYYDTYTLGYQATDDKYKVSRIPETNLKAVAVGGELNKNITPKEINDISTLTADMVGTLVKVNNVQVIEADKNKKLGDKDNSGYTTIKFTTIDKKSISLSNNNYADFNETVVPEGSGSISGILNTFGTDFQIALTSIEDLGLEGARFEIPGAEFVDKTVDALEETFSTATTGERVDAEGWFTEAVTGEKFWEVKEYSNAKYIQAAGYNSGQDAMETWVVSPGLNLDAADSKKNFTFDSKRGYTKAEVLKVLVSSDFDYSTGVAAATWEELTVTLPGDNSGYSEWLNAGVIDLSGKTGKVHVAFKYTGNQTDATGTWQIGNVKFNFTPEEPVEVVPSYNFENWTDGLPDGWNFVRNSGSAVTKVTDKQEGDYAMKVALDVREDFNITVATENNKTYKVSFWYKIEGTPGTNGIKLWSKVGDDYAGATLKGNKLDVQTEWTKYEATFESVATDSFKFEVRGYNADGLALYIDDFKVEVQ